MPLVLKNRVKSTTTTTGTGTITLGSAATGYQAFSVIGNANQTYYLITDGTNWETGVGTYTSSGTTLSRDRVFDSSTGGAKIDWAAGTKDVLCAYPSEATPGGVPYFDDSDIGTDLTGWYPFRAALEEGIVGGQTYSNNSVNGIISTFGLLNQGYGGAVLGPDNSIYLIPAQVAKGNKISINDVVSSYALAYSSNTYNLYEGGVLAANGDIHFVPNQGTAVGQKISASGVVSTYSLVYTNPDPGGETYSGGVLSPSGEVHFIPKGGRVGQKVSAAGVVSTYSLVYTTSNAYTGGVLAPNGDIHFIPHSARVGQKISAAGVVSTYSLVYTASSAYAGGVVAPNGDIHFIPYSANRGQKISSSGTVSTYSLVYTRGGAYYGGVLAPNGDIHFVPQASTIVGQKINVAGVVSTYALALTGDAFLGGILSPNGSIYFIPSTTTTVQKISTNPGQPLGPGVCLSSFLNKL